MEKLNFNEILNRKDLEKKILDFLKNFNNNINNTKNKRALYLYGENGIGKSQFIKQLLSDNNYDIIYYDSIQQRNKTIIDNITNNIISNHNVLSLLNCKPKNVVIIFDDIYSMNYNDKISLTNLIKLIKKKPQKNNSIYYPIICINNLIEEKKILDLMKISNCFKIESPTNMQLETIVNLTMPNLFKYDKKTNELLKINILNFLKNNIIKLIRLYDYYQNDLITIKFLYNYKNNNFDLHYNIKKETQLLLTKYFDFNCINNISDSNRTSVALLFHENISLLFKTNETPKNIIEKYLPLLNNFCYSDYIDRIIFQKQIWQINDICYLIKIYYNNFLLKKFNLTKKNIQYKDIIFTKILTKYSTEYNNYLFISNLANNLMLNSSDSIIFFYSLLNHENLDNIINELEMYNINKLIYTRINKFIDNILNYKINNTINLSNCYDIIDYNNDYFE
tara:strand:- start:189 stop:1538 length:1350 start_codon:yes stop_codon:yes gene_type:complete